MATVTEAGRGGSIGRASLAAHTGLAGTAWWTARYVVMIALAAFFALPYVWMVSGSIRTQSEIFANIYPLTLWTFVPQQPTLDNFRALLNLQPLPFTHYIFNSLFVSVTVTIFSLVVNSFAAYAFARLVFPGRDALFVLFLSTMIIPFEVLAIPLYLEMRWLGWVNTYQALIIPFVASPLGMFLLRQFFLNLPRELEEAARIDGCSMFGAFRRIVLPNSLPALIAFGIIRFQFSWDAFVWPLIVAPAPAVRVIQVAIASFDTDVQVQWNLILAAAVLASLPVVLIFAFLQRYYVQGMLTSGLK
ncbi:MAG: carbohydrate ABC transporter permease [Chloroflexi bacterium]|nr:carbohydrate ABC transporter permease [Chloroflexota bacterium]